MNRVSSISTSLFWVTLFERLRQEGSSTDVLVVITGVIAVVITLYGAINTAKNDAFKNLQQVNLELRTSLIEKNTEIKVLKHYQRILMRALMQAKIEIPPEDDEDSTVPTIKSTPGSV